MPESANSDRAKTDDCKHRQRWSNLASRDAAALADDPHQAHICQLRQIWGTGAPALLSSSARKRKQILHCAQDGTYGVSSLTGFSYGCKVLQRSLDGSYSFD
jgi:hypothetical protein